MKKFAASIPRRMYWSDDIGTKEICPECNAKLENESHTYLVVAKHKNDYEPFMIGNDGGYFCSNCPVVVLDNQEFETMASFGRQSSSSFQYTVAGIVDLDAIPEEKADLPIGGDDNPIPLVEFLKKTHKLSSRKEIGRNAPCPCGSGKKYKKCCGRK
jgi:hypothetical protein